MPEMFEYSALEPTATVSLALTPACIAPLPIATKLLPVVFDVNADGPKATL